MKKFLLFFALPISLLVASCLDNEEHYIAYGVIQNVASADKYEILTDNGNVLAVQKSETIHPIDNGKRVLVNFDVLSEEKSPNGMYDVKVNGFYNLLSKPVVYESFILRSEAVRRDSIGNDPFCSVEAWFGGDYININFEILHSASVRHLINLIYDDTKGHSDTLYLTLRQNAYDDANGYNLRIGFGRCSFKLSDLLPTGEDSKIVKLTWNQYTSGSIYGNPSSEEVFDMGIFKRSGSKSGHSFKAATYDETINVK